ncbi:MAG: hypothetical protein LBQ91_07090 [Oscillospiraceae bacterium]|nr:hypothetical protein [Oscillospiraceae bacterium]
MIGGFIAAAVICFGILAAIGTAENARLADALLAVAKQVVRDDPIFNDTIKHYAIDYSLLPENARAGFKKKFESWLSEFNDGEVETDYNILDKRGVLQEDENGDGVPDVFFLTLDLVTMSGNEFRTHFSRFGPFCATFGTYTAQFIDGEWQTAVEISLIS